MTLIVHQRIAPYTLRSQEKTLETFLQSAVKDSHINTRDFWKLREFYSVGTSIFPTTATSFGNTQHVHALSYCGTFPMLYFNSKDLQSTDYLFCNPRLRETPPLRSLLNQALGLSFQESNILYVNDNLLITTIIPNTLTLFFVAPSQEVPQTIGFFDFDSHEALFLEQALWLNRSDFVYTADIETLRKKLALRAQ